MVKAGNPLRGVFVVAPSGAAQLYNPIGSFPERGYAANPPSVCLSRSLVFQNVPAQVFKGDVRLSGESRNLRHPPTATPSKVRAATKPVPKITQIKRITVQDQAPLTSHHTTTPPVFPAKPATHALSPPSVCPRVAVDATPPNRLSGESRNLRHPPPQPPRRSGRQPNQSQKSPKSNGSQFKTKRPPPATTQPPPPVFPAKPGTHAPYPPSVYPRVAVDATPPTRLSGESRNLRHPHRNPLEGSGGNQNHSQQSLKSNESQFKTKHPQPQPPRRSGRQPNQSQKSPKSNESQFKTKRPPPVTTQPPHPSFQRNPEPAPPPHLPYTHESP